MALVCLANLVGIQTGPALDGDARPWRSETLSINRNKVAPAQFDPARSPAGTQGRFRHGEMYSRDEGRAAVGAAAKDSV